MVKSSPVWLQVALRPEDAAGLGGTIAEVSMRQRASPSTTVGALRNVRFISRAPEIDRQTGAQYVILEATDAGPSLPVGSMAEVEIVHAGRCARHRHSFVLARRQRRYQRRVRPAVGGSLRPPRGARDRALRREVTVERLRAGERLVSRGGAAIRRASLLSTGAPEGHVH